MKKFDSQGNRVDKHGKPVADYGPRKGYGPFEAITLGPKGYNRSYHRDRSMAEKRIAGMNPFVHETIGIIDHTPISR